MILVPLRLLVLLTKRLYAGGIGTFVLNGGDAPWEKEYVAAVQPASRAPLLNRCGKIGLASYLFTAANARLALCIDGLVAHLTAAHPLLTLFGPSRPLLWHYPAPHSLVIDARRFMPENKPVIAYIPAEAVVEVSCSLWDAAR